MKNKIKKMHALILALLLPCAAIIFMSSVSAQATRHKSDFNHMKTGFPLTGAHTNVECETCHAGGIFKGTPTDCAGCHSAGRRVVAPFKPANHVISNAPCEICHSNTVSFSGARYNHIGVQPNACLTCHNGSMGPGKPANHVVTTSQCDTCHRTSAWIPAGYNHVGVIPGSCANCHNGSTAIGKSGQHIVTTASCDSCHFNFTSFWGAIFNHTAANVIPGSCGTCHNGQVSGATTKIPNHIPYNGNACDSCHSNTGGYTSFAGPIMNHAIVAGALCKTCHDSSTNYAGAMDRMPVSHKNADLGVTAVDCSQSQCHMPAGAIGTTYIRWTN
jgi:hypothetical protein